MRASEPPPAVRDVAPALRAAGQGRLTWFGFELYDARLWVAPGFSRDQFTRHAFALELAYLRGFKAADVAKRSIEEMRRAANFSDEEAARWRAQLEAVLRDVRPGDRVTGLHRPGRGALFLYNGQPTGEIADARFAQLFFSIWLAPTTSEASLRESLLAGIPP